MDKDEWTIQENANSNIRTFSWEVKFESKAINLQTTILESTQKYLRMMDSKTKQLDHIWI